MRKILTFIGIIAILALVMKITCPEPAKHYEVATEKLTELFKERVVDGNDLDEIIEDYGIDKEMAVQFLVENGIYQSVVKYLVENNLYINDYFVCNIGKFTYDGEEYPLTLGMFGHVFVLTDYLDEIQKVGEMVEG